MWPSVPLEGAICTLQNSKKSSNSPKKLLIYEENGKYLCVLMSEAPLKVTQPLLLKLRWSCKPHPLMRRNGLVNQAEFLGLPHTFATVSPT